MTFDPLGEWLELDNLVPLSDEAESLFKNTFRAQAIDTGIGSHNFIDGMGSVAYGIIFILLQLLFYPLLRIFLWLTKG